jgi:hypothetical protein
LGDGWLPSFCTPDDVQAGRKVIAEAAETHGRQIDPEHWGALIAYSRGPVPDLVAATIRRRRPDLDPAELIPDGLDALRDRIEGFLAAGASKFVVIPLTEPQDWTDELAAAAAALLPLHG